MGIPLAMAADRLNRIIIIALCLSVWSIMAAMCGFATSFAFLLIARIGVAIGEAGGTPPSSSVIGDYFKPKSRANALAIFAMGVTIGGALSNYFGGPIAQHLNGPAIQSILEGWGWDWAVNMTDWSQVQGWRVAFVVIGAPGVLLAVLLLLTVKEPPRGFSDPPGTAKVEKANMVETLQGASEEADVLDDLARGGDHRACWLWPHFLPGADVRAVARHERADLRLGVRRAARHLCGARHVRRRVHRGQVGRRAISRPWRWCRQSAFSSLHAARHPGLATSRRRIFFRWRGLSG